MDRQGIMEMKKDRVEIPGKRYLIYYTFNNTKKDDNKTQKGQEKK